MTALAASAWWLLVLVALWPLSSLVAWFCVRPSLGALRDQYRWNWRVLIGPWAYFRWIDRKRHQQ